MAGKPRTSGYDKYVNHPVFVLIVVAFALLLLMPTPESMRDVGLEYALGRQYVLEYYARELFGTTYNQGEQWQAATARALEAGMMQGISSKKAMLKRDRRALANMGVAMPAEHFDAYHAALERLTDQRFQQLMTGAHELRYQTLSYSTLNDVEKKAAEEATWHLKVCIALVAFVVLCFMTEAIPLPGVAFCIGLILVFSGVVTRKEVASLYWSDACWFIMGSLMFAAAFVKTGVDKRICLMLFRYLAKPSVWMITGMLILVIAPSASFISDHALAAMFLPIGIILYNNSLTRTVPIDEELARMLMICICMACNIGGFGSPSGGARNVIMMTYMEDMFGLTMGYGEWILFGMPFVVIMMPILWLLLRWRFRPTIKDLSPALESLKTDIDRMGGWNRQQVLAVAIFALMLLGWITEKNVLLSLTGVRLGIGVIAVAGAVAYLLTGVVNWRDYQEKVDWGVVWLYAGAIIFGRVLDESGAAYWIARSLVDALASIGLGNSASLIAVGSGVTAGMTNLMADGPAAAAVGPVTLNMAAVTAPGTTLIPFTCLATACASSFAYLLIIGTPPNAIVYASGYLKPKDYLRVGVPCFVIAFLLLMLLSTLVWPALGFQNLPAF